MNRQTKQVKLITRSTAFMTVVACGLMLGCQTEPQNVQSPVFLPEQFSSAGSLPLPEKWWQSFGDPQLNELIEEALTDNFTIRSAWDRLSQAEQIAAKAGVALLPEVNYQADVSRSRSDISDTVDYSTEYSIGLVASYEVDLWGLVRSSQQAAVLDAQSAREDVSTAAVTLSANIAKTWYQLAEAKMQESLISKQLDTNQKVLEIITMQFRQGQTGAADVFRQRQLVESSRGQLILIRENNILFQHQLSILLGKNPGPWWDQQPIDLIELPTLPRTSIPSETLQRRPDIASAYKTIQAADQRVAAAIADQYPRISIFAGAETFETSSRNLFDDWLANLAAETAGPLFDAGLRKAEVERRRAVLSQLINDYAQAILGALKEVEDALNQESYQREYIENLQKQLALARQVSETTRQNYLKGQLDYLRVLESLVSQQTLERNELSSRRVLIERRIDLCRSIAGSWQLDRPARARIQ